MPVDALGNGYDRVTLIDPLTGLPVSGGGGGSGSTGSVTAAGTNGTTAQAVQGINGGIPVAVSGPALTSLDAKTPALLRPPLAQGTASIAAASVAQTANTTSPTVIANANSVTLMPEDSAVRRRRIQNLGTATIYARFNPAGDTTVAFIPAASGAGSAHWKSVVALAAGAMFETPIDEDVRGLVSVCSATANQTVAFTAS